ncbi:MAG: hypothetical protein J6C93_06315 [Clostridia bacterium]|nr:hypothetical protein [Clostridia bacterium]
MSMLMTIISREETRNENMINEYTKELETLPKGKITPKTVNGKTYYYLYYRDGKKVVSKYVGKDEESLIAIREGLARRSQIEEIVKKLKEEKAQIKKLEAML